MPFMIALQLAVAGSMFLGGGAVRIRATQTVTASSHTSLSSWHAPSFQSPGTCNYKKLLEAEVSWMAEVSYRVPLVGPVMQGTKIVAVAEDDFQSDFPPGQTSEISKELQGIVMEQFSNRHRQFPDGIVVKFPGGHAGFYPKSFDKFSKEESYRPISVNYCGTTATLRTGEPDYNTFSDVQWEDQTGEKMSSDEASYISRYAGSYSYASNVAGSVLNGLLPTAPDRNSGRASWSSQSLDALAKEVLNYDVMFAIALNKIPYPSSKVSLFRGAWETPETVQQLRSSYDQKSKIAQSRFMSTTLAADHACNFLSARNEPVDCRSGSGASGAEASGCVRAEKRFPVRYEFRTSRAKDIQQWNEKEQEFIVLPNHAFDVSEVEKVLNDRIYPMGPEELAAYVSSSFPEVAAAIRKQNIGGADFTAARAASPYRFLDTMLGYDMQGKQSWEVGWPLQNHYALSKLLNKDRFTMQCASMDIAGEIVENTVPYYYRIVLTDSTD